MGKTNILALLVVKKLNLIQEFALIAIHHKIKINQY